MCEAKCLLSLCFQIALLQFLITPSVDVSSYVQGPRRDYSYFGKRTYHAKYPDENYHGENQLANKDEDKPTAKIGFDLFKKLNPFRQSESINCLFRGLEGQCRNAVECTFLSGTMDSLCPHRRGICCQFKRSCGERTRQLVAYFANIDQNQNPRTSPEGKFVFFTTVSEVAGYANCEFEIIKHNEDICGVYIEPQVMGTPVSPISDSTECKDTILSIQKLGELPICAKRDYFSRKRYAFDLKDEKLVIGLTPYSRYVAPVRVKVKQVPCDEYDGPDYTGTDIEFPDNTPPPIIATSSPSTIGVSFQTTEGPSSPSPTTEPQPPSPVTEEAKPPSPVTQKPQPPSPATAQTGQPSPVTAATLKPTVPTLPTTPKPPVVTEVKPPTGPPSPLPPIIGPTTPSLPIPPVSPPSPPVIQPPSPSIVQPPSPPAIVQPPSPPAIVQPPSPAVVQPPSPPIISPPSPTNILPPGPVTGGSPGGINPPIGPPGGGILPQITSILGSLPGEISAPGPLLEILAPSPPVISPPSSAPEIPLASSPDGPPEDLPLEALTDGLLSDPGGPANLPPDFSVCGKNIYTEDSSRSRSTRFQTDVQKLIRKELQMKNPNLRRSQKKSPNILQTILQRLTRRHFSLPSRRASKQILHWSIPNKEQSIFYFLRNSSHLPQPHVRVTHGSEVQKGQIPWIAALVGEGTFLCGGSIIGDRHILTAAHCVTRFEVYHSMVKVLLGVSDLNLKKEPGSQAHEIENIFIHPEYSGKSLYNDVALIKTKERIRFNMFVRSVCLPYPPHLQNPSDADLIGSTAMIAGFGIDQTRKFKGKLRYIEGYVIENEECDKIWGAEGFIDRTKICVDTSYGDSCDGDSGGPAVIWASGRKQYVQHGIVSSGTQDCKRSSKMAGIYTRVSEYIPWIIRTIIL